jgi:hypothetical protein
MADRADVKATPDMGPADRRQVSGDPRDLVVFSRKRYERQGVLVEEAALEQAERECLADAAARERAAERREQLDERYVSEFAERLGDSFPGCPASERRAIADHACRKYSGRIGRSAAANRFDPDAIELAVRAHVRHRYTRYDELLAHGVDRGDARASVHDVVDEVANDGELCGREFGTLGTAVARGCNTSIAQPTSSSSPCQRGVIVWGLRFKPCATFASHSTSIGSRVSTGGSGTWGMLQPFGRRNVSAPSASRAIW